MIGDERSGRHDLRDQITAAANHATSGHRDRLDRLVEASYPELRDLARRIAARERAANSLNPTALVHEAWQRLTDQTQITQRGTVFFRASFAQTIRRVLVEHARANGALRRGGGRRRQTLLTGVDLPADRSQVDLMDLDDAIEGLTALPKSGARMAQVVVLRVFSCMTVPECAEVLGVSPRTVDQDWVLAREWLKRRFASSHER